MKQDSLQCHCFDIQGTVFFQTGNVFIDSSARIRVLAPRCSNLKVYKYCMKLLKIFEV